MTVPVSGSARVVPTCRVAMEASLRCLCSRGSTEGFINATAILCLGTGQKVLAGWAGEERGWVINFFLGIDTSLTQSTTKVTPFKQLKLVTHSNINPRSSMRTAISSEQWKPWTAVSTLLNRPHQHGTADGQK